MECREADLMHAAAVGIASFCSAQNQDVACLQAGISFRHDLLAAQKKMNVQGEMRVVGVNDTIMEIFEVTGFSEILTIE